MKCEWHRISDYVSSGEIEIRTGPFGTQLRASDYVASGIPVINVRNIGYGTINEEKLEYIDEQTAMRLSMHLLRTNDIVFGRKGAVDRHAFIIEKYNGWLQGSDCIRLRVNTKKLLPQYLSYYFLTKRHNGFMESMCSHGSTMASLNQKILEKIEFPYVSVENQMKIVEVLSAIDRKVMVNRNINANLQQQAQAIFKSWFVDFEPFQDGEFVESELGPIPKGWRVGELSEVATITMGQSPSGKSYNEEGNGSVFFQGRAEFGDRFPIRRLYTTEPKRMAEANSVLMSVRAPVGDINVAYEKCCIGRGLASIQSKFEYSSYMLYQMLSLKRQLDVFNGEGTVFGSINRDTLNAMKVLIPNEDSIEKFECTVAPMDKLVRANYDEICRLETARDTLLPKLMNGEIEVQ